MISSWIALLPVFQDLKAEIIHLHSELFNFLFVQSYKIDFLFKTAIFLASPGLMSETEYSRLVHWDDPEGWDGEEGGRGVQDGNTYTPMVDSCQCMAKTTTIL